MSDVVAPPSFLVPVVNRQGILNPAWQGFFWNLVAAPAAIVPIAVAASVFTYQASVPGHVLIVGGTVSQVDLIRGRVTVTTGLIEGFFPMGLQDQLAVTWAVIPLMYFVPFRANLSVGVHA